MARCNFSVSLRLEAASRALASCMTLLARSKVEISQSIPLKAETLLVVTCRRRVTIRWTKLPSSAVQLTIVCSDNGLLSCHVLLTHLLRPGANCEVQEVQLFKHEKGLHLYASLTMLA